MKQDTYHLSDQTLRKAVLARFAADHRMTRAILRVGVLNGIVHLAGMATSNEIRIIAAELATDIPGVRGVVNRIEAPGAPSPARTVNLNLHNEKENIDS